MEQKVDQVSRLTKWLFISGTCNILLAAGFFYWLVREVPPRPYCELKPAEQQEEQIPLAINHGNAEVIRNLRGMSMEQLIAKLNETQLVENGYSQRDLVLGALITFHHFDLPRALLGQTQPTQHRMMPYGKNKEGKLLEIIVHPGLSEPQFQAIVQYAQTERWPLTSQGLFQRLRKPGGQQDLSLVDAFYLTPEFLAVEMLFNRSEKNVEKRELLAMLTQGDWSLLSSFVEQQRQVQDLSPARRQKLLIDYIDRESRAAAYIMLKTDPGFALRKLDDEHVIAMLKLLVEKRNDSEQFALILLTSPRSDAVWQAASVRLFEFAGEPVPQKDAYNAALARFVKQKASEPSPAPRSVASPMPKAMTKPAAPSAVKTKKDKTEIAKKSIAKKSLGKKEIATADKKKPATPKKSPEARRPRMYVVSDGDSLWKIAKRFDADVEAIRKVNRLKSDSLKPGTALLIP